MPSSLAGTGFAKDNTTGAADYPLPWLHGRVLTKQAPSSLPNRQPQTLVKPASMASLPLTKSTSVMVPTASISVSRPISPPAIQTLTSFPPSSGQRVDTILSAGAAGLDVDGLKESCPAFTSDRASLAEWSTPQEQGLTADDRHQPRRVQPLGLKTV